MSGFMKGMTPAAMAEACEGIYYGPDECRDKMITSVTIDSRKVEDGCLFVAIKGERSDGHSYIGDCFDNGALCCISEKRLDDEKRPYIYVKSSLEALKSLAKYYREQLDIKVVGITGSVGKTSTKEVVASVLSQKYKVLKTLGNFNNGIGLPLTIFRLRETDEVAVLEMGISDFGEMKRLAEIAQPDICIITNIGFCHLENLKSRDGILKEKCEIFSKIKSDGAVILNGDDDKLCTVRNINNIRPVFYGMCREDDIYAENVVSNGLDGMSAVIYGLELNEDRRDTEKKQGKCGQAAEQALNINIPVAGQHMVYNAMAAAAAGAKLGLSAKQIQQGIAQVETISGRNHIIRTEKFVILDDCYNANPVSMKASVDILSETDGRTVCILGDMFELGENEKQLHYEVGTYIAEKNIDVLITVGRLAKYIAQGAGDELEVKESDARCQIMSFDDKQALIEQLGNILKAGDNILVKASHGMEFPVIIEALKNIAGGEDK